MIARQHLLHVPGPPAGPPGEPDRRHRAAVRAERPAHVHRRVRHHAADLPEHRGPDAGLGGRTGLGVRDRRHRDDRRVRRPVHPQDHPAGGDARHPGRHLDHLHLDAAGRADLGGGLDRPAGARHHPGRLLHQHAAARRHPGRPGRAAGRHRDRLDRRLHVGARTCRQAVSRHRHRDARRCTSTCCSTACRNLAPLLATAIPLGVYNFTEAMSNVESAAAAGDSYNLRSVLLADGAGAIIGSALGSPFPPAVYIGHPGWKAAGGRGQLLDGQRRLSSRCSASSACSACSNALLPIPAIVPILLYIGLLIGAQAFQAVPRIQAAAVVAAHPAQPRVVGDRADRQRAGRGRYHGRRGR